MDIDFATYEQSMILRELGFDRPCMGYFFKGNFIPCDAFDTGQGGGFVPFDPKLNFNNKDIIARPLYQQAFRWINDELRKFKKDFNVDSSKFFINFESPQDSLNKLIELLLKVKDSKNIGEDDKEIIVTNENLDSNSTIEDFSSKVQIINELKDRVKRYHEENISLRAKIRSYSRSNNELKNQKDKTKSESDYLNEEVVNLISKNKKNILEIEKLKNSFISISKVKEKIEIELQQKTEELELLEEKNEKLLEKNKILEENLSQSLNQIMEMEKNLKEMEKKPKVRKFPWLF